jgi:hypothetical protein
MGEQVLGLEVVLASGEISAHARRAEIVRRHRSERALHRRRGLLRRRHRSGDPHLRPPREERHPRLRLRHVRARLQRDPRNLQARRRAGGDRLRRQRGQVRRRAALPSPSKGAKEVVAAEEKIALAILDSAGGARLPDAQAEEFWAERHSIARRFAGEPARAARARPATESYRDWIHVALPASQVLPFRKAALEIVKRRGVDAVESGLWIRPELFSMPLRIDGAGKKDAQLILEETVEELLHLVHQLGGSMEYTHGVGVKLAPLMAEEHGYGLEVMRGIQKFSTRINHESGKMGL